MYIPIRTTAAARHSHNVFQCLIATFTSIQSHNPRHTPFMPSTATITMCVVYALRAVCSMKKKNPYNNMACMDITGNLVPCNKSFINKKKWRKLDEKKCRYLKCESRSHVWYVMCFHATFAEVT